MRWPLTASGLSYHHRFLRQLITLHRRQNYLKSAWCLKITEKVSLNIASYVYILTVSACKGAGIWPLDSQLETEIHSFSQSPPPGVSKYHRGPFDQRPQGPWRRSQSFDLHFGSFFANFQSAVALSV